MPQDRPAPIAIICALEEELIHLRTALPAARAEQVGARTVWHTDLDGRPIVLALCGLGMMSAAAVAEAVVIRQAPAAVLNYGCAGAHRVELLPGDIVIGERVVAYDSISERPDGGTHYIGMRFLRDGVQERVTALPADPALLDLALRARTALAGRHAPWPPDLGWPAGVPHRPPAVVRGTVASADRWNRLRPSIEAIAAQHASSCEDMEAAAIAMTCASHAVPFLAVKDISNNELLRVTDSGTSLMSQAGPELGRRAGALVLGVVRALAGPGAPL